MNIYFSSIPGDKKSKIPANNKIVSTKFCDYKLRDGGGWLSSRAS